MNSSAPQGPYPSYSPYPHSPVVLQPAEMPGKVKIARRLLFGLGGLQAVAGLFMVGLAAAGKGSPPAVTGATGALSLVLGAASLVVAARFASGGPGVRTGAMVIGGFMVVNALVALVMGQATGGVGVALGAMLLANCLAKESAEWFRRAR